MKEVRSDEWGKWIRPGSRVFLGSGSACPHALIDSMIENRHQMQDVELVHILTLGGTPWVEAPAQQVFSTNVFFQGQGTREAVNRGEADYTPTFLSEIPGMFRDGTLPLDVALVQVTPPDEAGYCSFGPSVDVVSAACREANLVIAQINPLMPRTMGQSFLHQSRIAAFMEAAQDLPELPAFPGGDDLDRIGYHVAQLVEDGATVQVGIGRVAEAVVRGLMQHRHLGLHTEMIGDVLWKGIEKGVFDNSRKSLHPGKTITSFAMGSRELYRFLHNNPHIEFHPTEYVNSPLVVARQSKMVAINSGLQVDLTGQVVADSLGHRFYSGIGGQVDFIRGASMCPDGRPIIALPSTARNGTVSRIVPNLSPGAGVVTSRGDVHYVVTEFGIATLRGRSIRERVLQLIQVAHPKFRDSLLREAYEFKWLPAYQRSIPTLVPEWQGLEQRKFRARDGRDYILRPLAPSDQRRLQEFFYSHTAESIQMRYGHAVGGMDRQRAYELVNIDQSRDLALAILEVEGPRQTIHAIGRYYLDPAGESAEVAFIVRESKRRSGLATVLMNEMVEVAQKRNLKRLWGRVRKDNLPMQAFFRRHGSLPPAPGDDQNIDFVVPLPPVGSRKARSVQRRAAAGKKKSTSA